MAVGKIYKNIYSQPHGAANSRQKRTLARMGREGQHEDGSKRLRAAEKKKSRVSGTNTPTHWDTGHWGRRNLWTGGESQGKFRVPNGSRTIWRECGQSWYTDTQQNTQSHILPSHTLTPTHGNKHKGQQGTLLFPPDRLCARTPECALLPCSISLIGGYFGPTRYWRDEDAPSLQGSGFTRA